MHIFVTISWCEKGFRHQLTNCSPSEPLGMIQTMFGASLDHHQGWIESNSASRLAYFILPGSTYSIYPLPQHASKSDYHLDKRPGVERCRTAWVRLRSHSESMYSILAPDGHNRLRSKYVNVCAPYKSICIIVVPMGPREVVVAVGWRWSHNFDGVAESVHLAEFHVVGPYTHAS